ncbi:hypothetical protein HR12_42905 [Microbacterium sp. SUBG005]|nr:hypothetical protein HR12_42905 [Microbacterium sp. SUBG005]
MEHATRIDLETWPRRQHFAHYLHASPCTYALTVEVDVTDFVAAVLRGASYVRRADLGAGRDREQA